ncbi:recombinase family protein [Qipengyuania atrilutea]|uniref:Recombinase family protein n=1 Tax=Qipengyuania atrilutea TaxID=2744473 RepID=A0A850H3S5_9SPHN|nr:recombinase family protein [Actirhodobacter atriluteus]NVD44852.1 recombinase family protein [Actirhodobacter atriluteus]
MQTSVIYARFSTSEQSKGYSLERQKTLGTSFAEEQGWQVENVITDEGRSAFHGANRLEGSALHTFEIEARNGLHDGKVLVVENIDRLSRQGAKAAAQLIWALNENGVSVATYHDQHIYSADRDGDMMDLFKLILLAQQSHEESAKKSRRTADSWAARFAAISDGKKVAVPHLPHWIDREGDELVLNPHRTAVLNEIFDLYIDGCGIHLITTKLNDRAEPTWMPASHKRQNNGWFYSYVYRLLTKRAVLGEYVTREGVTLASDFFPQAISAEKWNRVQATLAMRKGNQRRSRNQNRNLLAQMVVCSQCGGGAHFEHTTDSVQRYTKTNGEVVNYKRKTYRRLRCDRARRRFECDNNEVLNYDFVEDTILQEMLPRLAGDKSRSDPLAPLKREAAELQRLQLVDEQTTANLVDALAAGPSNAINARLRAIEKQMEQRSGQIEQLEREIAQQDAQPSKSVDADEVRALEDELTSEDDATRIAARGRVNMALRRLIDRILIHPNGTFEVQPDEYGSWTFDKDGTLLEGAYMP